MENKELENKDTEKKQIKKKKEKNIDSIFSFKSNAFRNGGFSAIAIVIMIAIVIILNLVVSKLPSKYIEYDMSSNKVYSMSDASKKFVKKLDKDVTIYYLVSESSKKNDTMISKVTKLVEQYEESSQHIDMQIKDPELYPTFGQKYDATSSTILIVECGDRYKIVNSTELYSVTNEEDVSYYGATAEYDFNGDSVIANAISYVTTDDLPKIYCLTSDGEIELDDTIKKLITDANFEVEDLDLLTSGSVPEDCDCLIINSPERDFSESATKAILEFLKNGGKTMISADYLGTDMPNFTSILKEYGVEIQKGMVFEGDANYMVNNSPIYCVPEFYSTEITSDLASGKSRAFFPSSQSIKELDDKRATLNVEPLLKSSSQAFLKKNPENAKSYEKEEGDASGPFDFAVAITDTKENAQASDDETTETSNDENADTSGATNAQLVVFGSSAVTDVNIYSSVTTVNSELFLASIGWMCGHQDSLTIASKNIQDVTIMVSDENVNFWMSVYLTIPVIFIVTGIVIVVRRRRR